MSDSLDFIQELLAEAMQGNAIAQCNIGRIYDSGIGVPEDNTEAVKWYRKSAEQGCARAQFHLGVCYDNGEGVPEDKAEAVKWYRLAAEQGHANAQCNLGVCYECGEGVPVDQAEAIKWYRKAAEQGHAEAQFNLGVMYSNGEGVPVDKVEAVKWYRKAAEQGAADAQNILAWMYDTGEGVSVDKAEAVKWYRKAAEQGAANAQLNLGRKYYTGEGVPVDKAEAVKWYRKAAEQGDVNAQLIIGVCYEYGIEVPIDKAEAVMWNRKAAEQGDAYAQNNLGLIYDAGEGVSANRVEAVKWYRLAAEQGHANAQFNLGVCYECGEGVPVDQAEAIKWYRKAAEQGDTDATRMVEQLEESVNHNENGDSIESLEQQGGELESTDAELQMIYDELNQLIGLESVKREVKQFVSLLQVLELRMQRGLAVPDPSRHLVFTGNPGTGKTTVARIIAKIYGHLGFLSKGHSIETDRTGMVGQYLGHTGEKTKVLVESAIGGVLFIDEAYSLSNDERDCFGKEAVDVLVKMMEDHRDDLVVIVAGYKKEMNRFLDFNPGLKSRFNTYLEFEDYTPDELVMIFKKLCEKNDYVVSESAESRLVELCARMEHNRPKNFANARFVRNVFEKTYQNQASRIAPMRNPTDQMLRTIEESDISGTEFLEVS